MLLKQSTKITPALADSERFSLYPSTGVQQVSMGYKGCPFARRVLCLVSIVIKSCGGNDATPTPVSSRSQWASKDAHLLEESYAWSA